MTDDDDSLLRAVAAAPRATAPAVLTTIIVVRAPRDGILRVRSVLAELAGQLEELAEDVLGARLISGVGERDAAVRAAAGADMVHEAVAGARVAIATDRTVDPSTVGQLRDRARQLLDACDEARPIRLDERTTMLVDDARGAKPVPIAEPLRTSIDRAIREERDRNIRRVFALLVPLLVAIVALTWFRARYGTANLPELPWFASWLGIATIRIWWLRARPAAASWLVYSLFVVEIPLYFVAAYLGMRASPRPEINAVYAVTTTVIGVAATQLFVSRRLLLAVASTMLAGSATLSVLAGYAPGAPIAAVTIGCVVTVALYGQSRLKTLLKSIVAETELRARDAEAANAELRRQIASRSRELAEALAQVATAPAAPTRLVAGDVIESRYRVVRRLGSGGMGQVFEAERLTDGRRFALKTLTGAVHREALARFAREAQITAELDAPNLVAAVDIGVTQSGTLFLVMELVTGASLAAAREQYGDARWAVPILAQVARALAAMHGRGIVHRDLKPSNILLDGATVKVADFGIAGLVGEDPLAETIAAKDLVASPELTRTGAILGTPLYMAPELVRGAGAAGPAADIFSFGVVAYELLAGKLPHAAPPVLEKLAGRAIPTSTPLARAKPDLSTELCALVDRCLAEAPDARPTAQVVVSTLAAMIVRR